MLLPVLFPYQVLTEQEIDEEGNSQHHDNDDTEQHEGETSGSPEGETPAPFCFIQIRGSDTKHMYVVCYVCKVNFVAILWENVILP